MAEPPDGPIPSIRLPGNLEPLGFRNFLLYWIGFVTSNTGKNIELIGAVWLVSELTDSPFMLGLLGIARAVPQLLLSPVAGVVVDRLNQRKLLFFTQFASLIGSFVLGMLILTGNVQVWQVYVEVAVGAVIQSFDAATRQALFPRLVPRRLIPEAVTLQVSAGRTSAFVGPIIGGLAIAWAGVAAPFLLNAATFLALMGALVLMRGVAPRPERERSSFRRELTEGMHVILRSPVLSGLLKLEVVFNIFSINAVIITIIARDVLQLGPEGLGGLLSADALGSLVGIVTVLLVGQTDRQGRFSILCTFVYAAAIVLFAFSREYVLSFAALAITGVMDVLVTVTRNTVLQLAAPAHMRGRVMANMRVVTGGLSPLAETSSGALAGVVGGPAAAATAAVALAVAAGFTARANPELWRLRKSDQVDGHAVPHPVAAVPLGSKATESSDTL